MRRFSVGMIGLGVAISTLVGCGSDDEGAPAGASGGGGGIAAVVGGRPPTNTGGVMPAAGGASTAGGGGVPGPTAGTAGSVVTTGGVTAVAGAAGSSAGTVAAAGNFNLAGAAGLPPMNCTPNGSTCQTGADCCSRLCDVSTNTCVSRINLCAGSGQPCTAPTDCCGLSCVSGTCQSACTADNVACTSDAQCCGGRCNTTCVPLNTACRTAGNPCAVASECCSKSCRNGSCELAASYCIQVGDTCGTGDDCCTGICTIATGAALGVCAEPPAASANCRGVDGMVCSSCNECCDALCVPYGPTGVHICQASSGCRVTGDLCREDRDCCGGDPDSGLPGAGNVACEKDAGATIGRCNNGQSCTPHGGACHYKDYACGVSSKNAACCGATGASSGACQLDRYGVPRCNSLPACRPAGETCASTNDCCDGLPCVRDAAGTLRCYQPPGSNCVPMGGSCTVTGDCCRGTECLRLPGSTQGVCGIPQTPGTGGSAGAAGAPAAGGAPGGAGGVPAAGGEGGAPTGGSPPWVCSEYGQTCGTALDCCNDVPCVIGYCVYGTLG